MDPLAIDDAFFHLNSAWMRDPAAWLSHCSALGEAMRSAGEAVADHFRSARPQAADGGKALGEWADVLAWSSRQYHGVLDRWLNDYVERAPELDAELRRRAHFWVRQVVEMLAPANFFWSNPRAVQRMVNTNGESLLRGVRNWSRDARGGATLPRLADREAFVLGRDLAATPGQVVHRNRLVEIIQYAPQTDTVRQAPIVLIPPWINKYYILDLSPHNSLVRFLVDRGYTVFITSWKNPAADMADVDFEDYLRLGALQAIEAAREITGWERVHAAGYCIGGTLLAALLGWLAHEKRQPVVDATFFATLLDFSEPGDMRALVNAGTMQALEPMVRTQGVLPGANLAMAFRMLNPGDLIWRNMVSSYFNGDDPPRSDMLFWNSDSTNLPGAMCLFYLKVLYLQNRLAEPGLLVLADRPIDLKRVRLPLYVVGALKDHICPWEGTFQSCRMTSGPVRYVLSNEGHITGIVDPPSRWSKKKYWAGPATRRRNAPRWLQNRAAATGSWWGDWLEWLRPRSGGDVPPPAMGSLNHRALEPAPGRYVLE